jgi:hypothetical protein
VNFILVFVIFLVLQHLVFFFFFFLHFVQVMGLGGVYCYWVFEIVVSFGNYIWVLLLHFFF